MEKHKMDPAPFLQLLPLVIRDEIYRYLLSTKYTKHPCVARQVKFLRPASSVLLTFTAASEESNVQLLTASVTLDTNRCEIMACPCLPS